MWLYDKFHNMLESHWKRMHFYEFRRGFVDSRCKITARESKFCKKSAATEAFRRQQSRVQTGNVVLVRVSSHFSNKLIFVKIIRNRKTCTRRVPEAHSFLAQKWRNREFTIWWVFQAHFSKMGTECSPDNEIAIWHHFGRARMCFWYAFCAYFNFSTFSWNQNMLRLQWSEEDEHFVSSQKYCFCRVCFQKSLCRCNNLWPLPTNALRKLKKDASGYDFCVFAFFIRNMSGNASCTNNMSVSDCRGNHENIAYFICFINNRDGWGKSMFSTRISKNVDK